jgi:catechol 2,3-dioxygenase-like lactoylglutathione lyase family enzyme
MPSLDAITIVVRDVATSLAFYRLAGVVDDDALVGCYAATSLGRGARLEWTVEPSAATAPPAPVRLGIRCADSDELEQTYRSVVAAGHRAVSAPHDASWGARVCRVLDPDGNTVELYTPWP